MSAEQGFISELLGVNAKQEEVVINNVKIGGLPGINPPLLIGSLFYMGDKLVEDPEKGIVKREEVRKAVSEAVEYVEKYRLKLALDIIMYTGQAAETLLPFISDVFDGILFLDGVDEDARITAVRVADEIGVMGRSVVNAIYTTSTDREIEAYKEHRVENAVLMVFDPHNPLQSLDPRDKLRITRETLMPLARKAGITNMLLDTVVLDPASISFSAASIRFLKNKLGLPVGCAPANVAGSMSKKILGDKESISTMTGIAVMLRVFGADFLFYGPLKKINSVAAGIAVVESLLGYLYRSQGVRIPRDHPITGILKEMQKAYASQR